MEMYREGQKELHCVFVDLEKAYDKVPREQVWYCIIKSGLAEKYVRIIQDIIIIIIYNNKTLFQATAHVGTIIQIQHCKACKKNCFTCIVINYTQVFRIYATVMAWHYMYSDSRHEDHIYLPLI